MTLLSPVITWNSATTPFPQITSLAFTGSGPSGAIPMGTASALLTVRLYNNFAAAANIADATACVLTTYDDAVHEGIAAQAPSVARYMQVQVVDYNGVTTGADGLLFPIGGIVKHSLPTNSGVIGGTGANYVTIQLQVVIPAAAPVQGATIQGVWLEYNSVA